MILAHDLGTTGDKATLVRADGSLAGSVTAAYPVDLDPNGKAEQNPSDWWDAVCTSTRELLAKTGTSAADVDVVSFSGQMMGAVFVDTENAPLRPAIIWADTRSSEQSGRILARVGMERGYRITGHRINPTYSLSKIAWLRDHEPEVFDRTDAVLLPKDYLVARLTGVRATDPSDASGTNAYDQGARAWSDEMLDAAGIQRRLLPDIVPSTTVIGSVTGDAAQATGLRAGTPVVIGGGDGPMAALGAGIVDAASGAYAYLGSSSWLSVASSRPLWDPTMRSMTFDHVVPGQFVPTATMQTGGASLQWIAHTLGQADDDGYADILRGAAGASAAYDGLFFLPHLLGERSPYWNPRARAAFVGVHMHHGRDSLTRAVLEGVAFNLYSGLLAFRESGIAIDSVDVIGGAARADALLTIMADVWGVSITRRSLVGEATSIGAAIVGGVGVGVFSDFTVARSFSEQSPGIQAQSESTARYRAAYEQFLDAYTRLEPWFDAL